MQLIPPDYLAGVPSLPDRLLARLQSGRPLTPAEQAAADAQLELRKEMVRHARQRENARRDEPIEPEPPFGTT